MVVRKFFPQKCICTGKLNKKTQYISFFALKFPQLHVPPHHQDQHQTFRIWRPIENLVIKQTFAAIVQNSSSQWLHSILIQAALHLPRLCLWYEGSTLYDVHCLQPLFRWVHYNYHDRQSSRWWQRKLLSPAQSCCSPTLHAIHLLCYPSCIRWFFKSSLIAFLIIHTNSALCKCTLNEITFWHWLNCSTYNILSILRTLAKCLKAGLKGISGYKICILARNMIFCSIFLPQKFISKRKFGVI